MNKSELIAEVAEKSGESKAAATRVVEALQDVVIEQVAKGEEVKLTGFLTIDQRTRAAREGKNPQTQETIQIPEKKVARVRVGKRFADTVANG